MLFTKKYSKNVSLADIESEWIVKALDSHKGNIMATSKSLKISRATLYRKIKEVDKEELKEILSKININKGV